MPKACNLGGGAPNSIVGYCGYHRRTLTAAQLKSRECLRKQCPCLVRRTEHPYWEEREKRKQMRRERKIRVKERLKAYETA